MKKLVYFSLLLIMLSMSVSGVSQEPPGTVSASTSGEAQKPVAELPGSLSQGVKKPAMELAGSSAEVNQESTNENVASNSQTSLSQLLVTDSSIIPPSEIAVSKSGEALTPLQLQLQEAINQRKAAGLPVPSSVQFEYQATSADAMQQITGAVTPTGPVKIISTTTIAFDGPKQAGHDEWPALIVKDYLPAETHGRVLEGDYTEAYRGAAAEKFPGIWEKYEFGQEPRIHTIVETFELTEPQQHLLNTESAVSIDAINTGNILTGFTYEGPHIPYFIEHSWDICDPTGILGCLQVYDVKAGFGLDWAVGLRLPGQVNLTGPDMMVMGSPYSLSSALTPLDWSINDYTLYNVADESGNEFVFRMKFFVGMMVKILSFDICPSCYINLDVDKSTDFQTPFGSGAYFPIPPVEIPLKEYDLAVANFSVGVELDPNLGSDKITADWQAAGNAVGNGTLTYITPAEPVSFGPISACNFGSTNSVQFSITNFQYWFNQFKINLNATATLKLVDINYGFGTLDGPQWTKNETIITIDLSDFFGGLGLHVGKHVQCEWDFTCSNIGPDNTLNLSIPVVDLNPPSTLLTRSGNLGNNDWYVSDVQVSLSATDLPAGCGIGVKQTEYSFDGTTWNVYTGPFTVSNEGATTVYYRSIDNEDNVEPIKTQDIKIDKTPPTITGAPTTSPNSYGWYNTDVVVHFDAVDAVSGISTVTPDQILSIEATNQSVTGTAVDMAGLTASFTVTGINIDKTSPNLSITSPEARVYENIETFNIIWSATDSLSGIASENGTMDEVAAANGQLIELLLFGPGPHTVAVEAIDKADNISSASVMFSVSVDSEGLLAAIEYMCDLGWINKHGICNSLEAKVNAAIESINRGNLNAAENQLNAFINELEAQKDKSNNQSAYDVLKTDALYVIDHLADEQ